MKYIKIYFFSLSFCASIAFIVDNIYPLSIYSDLDYFQTIVEVSHGLRYFLFLLIICSTLFVCTITLNRIFQSHNYLYIGSSICIIFLTCEIVLSLLRMSNVSIIFTLSLSIVLPQITRKYS